MTLVDDLLLDTRAISCVADLTVTQHVTHPVHKKA